MSALMAEAGRRHLRDGGRAAPGVAFGGGGTGPSLRSGHMFTDEVPESSRASPARWTRTRDLLLRGTSQEQP